MCLIVVVVVVILTNIYSLIVDTDNNGRIDIDELERALIRSPLTRGLLFNDSYSVTSLIQRFDLRQSGDLDFAEFFLLYDLSRRERLDDLLAYWNSSMVCFADSPLILHKGGTNLLQAFMVGSASGCVGRTFTAPLSRMVIIAQAQMVPQTSVQIMQRLWTKEGVRGLWRGNLATLFKIGPTVGINMSVFDSVQKRLEQDNFPFHTTPTSRSIIAGAIAGACGALITHPLDVVKARMSMMNGDGPRDQSGVFRTLRSLSLREAYSGLTLSVVETAPQAAIRFALMLRARDMFVKTGDQGNPTQVPSSMAIIGSSAVAGIGMCVCVCVCLMVSSPDFLFLLEEEKKKRTSLTSF